MFPVYENPDRREWPRLYARPADDTDEIEQTVSRILQSVKREGDAALFKLTKQLDGVELNDLFVSPEEIDSSAKKIGAKLAVAIEQASKNIRLYHKSQKADNQKLETMPGVLCWQKQVAVPRVGLYIPGGSAPLFSTVLMLAIPAKLAGCSEIVLCTPPQKDGQVHTAILYAAKISGVDRIAKVGGAQAIAAMAYGTKSIPKVDKLFGPGNRFVTLAKQIVAVQGVAIDMPAGPSEVLVIADDSADPSFVAADLLAQAEHGPDSQVLLLAQNISFIKIVRQKIEDFLPKLTRQKNILRALRHSRFIVFSDIQTAMDFSNGYAPEHLILHVQNPSEMSSQIVNAGSVFLGSYSPEAVGDYASGPNHTLPTNGYARNYSGVSVRSFQKDIFFQQISPAGLRNIGPIVETLAEAEQLQAHRLSVAIRLDKINGEQ